MKISGKFIYLRNMSIKDSYFIYKLRNNKFVGHYLHKPPKTLKDQKNWANKNIRNYKTEDFIIISKKKKKKIGTIALDNICSKNAEWGRWIAIGKTIENIESVILLLNYGFQIKKLKKIYSLTNVNNKKVINFHKRTPAKYEGLIKSLFIIKNKKTNAAKFSFNKKKFIKFKNDFYFMTKSIH